MKKFAVFVLALSVLSGCGVSESPTPNEPLSFAAAKNGFLANGRMYFSEDNFIRYTNLATGQSQILCYDPLCSHNYGEIDNSECIALSCQNDFLGRVLVDGDTVWFLATVAEADVKTYHTTYYYQLRSIDLSDMSLSVYLKDNETEIWDFWLCGEDIFLSLPNERTTDDGSTYSSGGSIYRLTKNGELELMLEDTEDVQYLLLDAGPGCIYYTDKFSDRKVWKTTYDFREQEPVAALPSDNLCLQIYGEYAYYLRPTGEKIHVEGMVTEGEYQPDVSIVSKTVSEAALYRQKLDGTGEPELVYASLPVPMQNIVMSYSNYGIDRATGTIYVTPFDPACTGYTMWEMNDAVSVQMGILDPILTNVFTETGGRLIAIDPDTLETKDVLMDAGVDILDICAVGDGAVMGYFQVTDIDRLLELRKAGESMDSALNYRYYGILEWNE